MYDMVTKLLLVYAAVSVLGSSVDAVAHIDRLVETLKSAEQC